MDNWDKAILDKVHFKFKFSLIYDGISVWKALSREDECEFRQELQVEVLKRLCFMHQLAIKVEDEFIFQIFTHHLQNFMFLELILLLIHNLILQIILDFRREFHRNFIMRHERLDLEDFVLHRLQIPIASMHETADGAHGEGENSAGEDHADDADDLLRTC